MQPRGNNPDPNQPPQIDDPVRRAAVETILAAAGIDLAVVHGSRARSAARPDSDLDVGILAIGAKPVSYRAMGAIARDLSKTLAMEVDVADLATPDAIFRFEVARCAQPIFQHRADAFTDFLAKAMIDYADIQRFVPELIAGVARQSRRETASEPAQAPFRR